MDLLWQAKFVKIFTTRSNLCLGEYPQTVAGLITEAIKSSDLYLKISLLVKLVKI